MEPSLYAAFGLGLILGVKHALDADHLVAVSTIVSEHKDLKWASLIGAFWGLGHTATLFAVGL
ncbi:MAG: urease accessory protein UreH, partial [Deltaproteobacteria bacterium]|nr:urease accessory protein UreH [Deltaproteobacteria bacterium]